MREIIWKTVLPLSDVNTIQVPKGAKFLTVQVQPQIGICVWYRFDRASETDLVSRGIAIIGTGNQYDPANLGDYLGTFQIAGGNLVFHAFESRR